MDSLTKCVLQPFLGVNDSELQNVKSFTQTKIFKLIHDLFLGISAQSMVLTHMSLSVSLGSLG